ncbi:MAG: 50S ribosomal protein L25 [Candidatus Aminicenantes bacterium]|jgi:large subunit ribosomal protein L25
MSVLIKGEKRESFGKNVSRRIRRDGRVPAILYGPDMDNIALVLDKKDIFSILKSETGENTLFKLSFDSEKRDAMIKDLQTDPVTDELLHVDLIQIAMDKAVRVAVPIELVGESVGVKTEGGFVDFSTREIEVECLPKAIPEQIEVDISNLHLHQSFKVEELQPPEGTEITSDPDTVIVLIQAPTREEEIEVEAEEEEEVIGEEEEPEVIKKEKLEEEEKREDEKEKKE